MELERLTALIQAGERDRLGELWERTERFIAGQARLWLSQYGGGWGVTLEDLYHSGFLALAAAAETYDPARGMSFIGWLALALRRAFAEAGGYRTRKQAMDPLRRAVSLNLSMGEDEDGETLEDLQADPEAEAAFLAVDEGIYTQQLHDALERALEGLTEAQEAVLRGHYYQGVPLQQLGPEARTTERAALRALRAPNGVLRRWLDQRTPYLSGTGLHSFRHSGPQPERLCIERERWTVGRLTGAWG